MDPLSIAASIVAVVQATNVVLKTCYKLRAAFKDPPTILANVVAEVRDLRGVLEKLERASDRLLDDDGGDDEKKNGGDSVGAAFGFLCDAESGPLKTCHDELAGLEAKLALVLESRRRTVMMALGLGINEAEVRSSLGRIERCKSSLVLALTADNASMLRTIVDATEALQRDLETSIDKIDGIAADLAQERRDEEFKSALDWLSPLDPAESHQLASRARLAGTCRWLQQTYEFRDWAASPGPAMLWMTASPGTGKSTLFASLVDHLLGEAFSVTKAPSEVSPEAPLVAYFYCDFRHAEKQSLLHILGSLVAQLFSALGRVPPMVSEAYHNASSKTPKGPTTLDLLRSCLLDLPTPRRVFVLVDALDENPSRVELAEFFADLLRSSGEDYRLCVAVTSRKDSELAEVLGEEEQVTTIRLEEHVSEIARDIDAYVSHRLEKDRKLKALTQDVRDHVGLSLNKKAHGMFRWVQCQLDSISSLRTAKAVKGALDSLPEGLNETYARILTDIPKADGPMFRKILLWLSFAVLPLTLRQMSEVVAFEHGTDAIEDDARLGDAAEVLSIAGSLLSTVEHPTFSQHRPGDSIVRLAHLSVRDFLMSPEIKTSRALADLSYFALDRRQAHRELARSCLGYLSFAEFCKGPASTNEEAWKRRNDYPLLSYAAIAFPYHLHEAKRDSGKEEDSELDDLVAEFFTTDGSARTSGRLFSWVQALLHEKGRSYWSPSRLEKIAEGAPLYYAASFGLVDVVKVLLARKGQGAGTGEDLSTPSGRFGGTPLHAAVYRGHLPVVKLLLDAGADPSVVDRAGHTPMSLAVWQRFDEAIDLLAAHGAVVCTL